MFGRVHIPSLDGAAEWLDSEPLGPADLRGHVVLVNFWTLTCINWLRQEPYVRAWSQAYRNDGLIVIGVHTPEFSFEHEIDRVHDAIDTPAIGYPVAVDNDYAIWGALANQYWPTLYFIDKEGIILDQHFGAGRYEQSERTIQRLLGIDRELVVVTGLGVEAAADWDHLQTPETYLGYARSERFASRNGAVVEPHAYEIPEHLRGNHWALAGEWLIDREKVVVDQAGGSVAYRFHARDAHLVLSAAARERIPFSVRLDGEPPGQSAGTDIDEDGNGVLRDGRLYQLVRQHNAVRERTLEITFSEPGAEAWAFTFRVVDGIDVLTTCVAAEHGCRRKSCEPAARRAGSYARCEPHLSLVGRGSDGQPLLSRALQLGRAKTPCRNGRHAARQLVESVGVVLMPPWSCFARVTSTSSWETSAPECAELASRRQFHMIGPGRLSAASADARASP